MGRSKHHSRNGRNQKSNNGRHHHGGRNKQHHHRRSGGGGSSINIGSAKAARDKYNEKAKEAYANGDRILAENYFQHADHYNRLVMEAQQYRDEMEQTHDQSSYGDDTDHDTAEASSPSFDSAPSVKEAVEPEEENNSEAEDDFPPLQEKTARHGNPRIPKELMF